MFGICLSVIRGGKCGSGWSRLAVICGLLGLRSEYLGIHYAKIKNGEPP